ncbi:hypothetical protein L596_010490 [Steinernema carpocapsae]|uniref:Uncharacterized protein n=1 Tax=Steinernema carpocapsae TaxID=34508 RepID=A0A4U5PIT0_STECR|nr:hypothetical protein L596_010490 [Steinernema carpocapsae]
MIAGTSAPFLQNSNVGIFNEIKTQITAVQEGMIEVRDAVMCGIEMTTFNDIARTASDFARSFEASLSAATHTSQCEVTRCFAAACQDLRPGEQLNRLQHILNQPVNYAKKCLESDGFKVNTFNSLLRQTQDVVFILSYQQYQHNNILSVGLKNAATKILRKNDDRSVSDVNKLIDTEARKNYADNSTFYFVSTEVAGKKGEVHYFNPAYNLTENDRVFVFNVGGKSVDVVRISTNQQLKNHASQKIDCCLERVRRQVVQHLRNAEIEDASNLLIKQLKVPYVRIAMASIFRQNDICDGEVGLRGRTLKGVVTNLCYYVEIAY